MKNDNNQFKNLDMNLLNSLIHDAVEGVEGFSMFSENITESLSRSLLGKEKATKGIKVQKTSEGLVIDIYLEVKYGTKIPQFSWEVQKQVNKSLVDQGIADIKSVNIHVLSVNF